MDGGGYQDKKIFVGFLGIRLYGSRQATEEIPLFFYISEHYYRGICGARISDSGGHITGIPQPTTQRQDEEPLISGYSANNNPTEDVAISPSDIQSKNIFASLFF